MLIQVPQNVAGLKNATVRRWLKRVGQGVKAGEVVVELETEDALVQLQAAGDGVLGRVVAEVGKTVAAGGELGELEVGGAARGGDTQGKSTMTVSGIAGPVEVAAPGGMPILMPQAGNSMEEGTILKWRVKVGDMVVVGQVICEVETDKASVEVEATEAGKVGWLAAEGSVVAVKQPIAMIGDGVMRELSAPRSETRATEIAALPPEGGTTNMRSNGVPILMPQAGNTMEEGTILKWRVKVGDSVAVGHILCDIETDKATVEMESTHAGKIAWLAAEGSVIPVKQAIAFLGDAPMAGPVGVPPSGGINAPVSKRTTVGQASPKEVAAPHSPKGGTPSGGTPNGGTRLKVSPAARKFAAERGIDLATIGSGSGPGGRILSTDLANVKVGSKEAASAAIPPKGGTTSVAAAGPMGALSGGRKALSKMRKAIAVNLQTSKQTVPHFYVKLTIHADPLFAFYRAQKPATGCTLNDVILLAVGRAVGEFGAFRSRLEGNEIVEAASANIGVAVSVPDGLVVPVVLGVHGMTLGQLAREAKRVVESARNGKIENMGKGVFTISNMGMLGVEDFAAIINPPESGILAISGVREAVIVKDGAMRAGRVMSMTLSVDHRVVDGALAAQFMGRLRELLENPETLLG